MKRLFDFDFKRVSLGMKKSVLRKAGSAKIVYSWNSVPYTFKISD